MWSGTQVLAKYCHELRILTCFCGLSILLQLRPRCGKQTPLVWSLQNCSITHAHAHMHTHVRSFVKKLLKIIIVILYKNYDSSTAKRSGSFEKIWLERVFFFKFLSPFLPTSPDSFLQVCDFCPGLFCLAPTFPQCTCFQSSSCALGAYFSGLHVAQKS